MPALVGGIFIILQGSIPASFCIQVDPHNRRWYVPRPTAVTWNRG